MYKIIAKEQLAPEIVKLQVEAPQVAAKAEPGHFLIVRVSEKSERIPLTIADYDKSAGTVTIIVQKVGFSTEQICNLAVGSGFLDLAGPLGEPVNLAGYQRVVCVAGGLGAAPLYPKAKELNRQQAEITTILGAQQAEKIILEDQFSELSQNLYLATDDGSRGHEGFVTEVLEELLTPASEFDLVIAIGPMVMMKAVSELTADYGIKTLVSLNSIMVDGTGMCGGCRVTIGGETKFACVDGPTFDGHQVDFTEQMRRKEFYAHQEELTVEHAGGEYQCQNHQ